MEITSQTKGFDEGVAGSEKKLGAFIERAKGLLAAAAVAGAGMRVGHFLLEAAEAGSNLGETMSKVKEVFGSSTGQINALAESMANQFGSVKKVTLDAAANLGLVAQGAGLSSSAAANMASKLVRLADDASSFYNVELDVALEKIRSGLVGEAEPLRAFGVLLSETAVKQKLLQQGIKAVHGEFTEAQKVMARSQIIIEGLNKASGDHERTLSSYANQVRRLKGEFENWKADFGAPIAAGTAQVMSDVRENGLWQWLNTGGQAQRERATGKVTRNYLDMMTAKDKGLPGVAQESIRERADRERMESITFQFQRLHEQAEAKRERNVTPGAAFGGMGLAFMGIQPQLMARAALPGIEKQIEDLRNRGRAFGGHGTEFESFARERAMEREDPVQKEQLRELTRIRDGILTLTMIPKNHGMGMKFPAGARE